MSTPRSDELLFAAGGDVWEKYGTFVKRTLPEEERGSFSRSSDATYTDRSGNLRTAESGILRPHYVSSESSYSARLETARTNSILHSKDFSDAWWSTTDVSITTDDATAPDGTTFADKADETNSSGVSGVETSTLTVSDDSLDRAAVWFVKKRSSGPNCALQVKYSGGTSLTYEVQLDPTDGSTDASRVDSPTRFGVEDFNDNWWRLWVVGANNGTGNTGLKVVFFPAISSTLGGVDASLTGYQHLWGAQLEGVSGGASFPSAYIKTTSSAVSRAADSLTFPISFGPQEMTVYCKFVERGTRISSDTDILVHVGPDGLGDGEFFLWSSGGSAYRFRFTNDSGNQASAQLSDQSFFGDVVELRGVMKSDGSIVIGQSLNGGSETTATDSAPTGGLGSVFGQQELHINSDGGPRVGFADFISLAIAPGVRTLPEMRSVEV